MKGRGTKLFETTRSLGEAFYENQIEHASVTNKRRARERQRKIQKKWGEKNPTGHRSGERTAERSIEFGIDGYPPEIKLIVSVMIDAFRNIKLASDYADRLLSKASVSWKCYDICKSMLISAKKDYDWIMSDASCREVMSFAYCCEHIGSDCETYRERYLGSGEYPSKEEIYTKFVAITRAMEKFGKKKYRLASVIENRRLFGDGV